MRCSGKTCSEFKPVVESKLTNSYILFISAATRASFYSTSSPCLSQTPSPLPGSLLCCRHLSVTDMCLSQTLVCHIQHHVCPFLKFTLYHSMNIWTVNILPSFNITNSTHLTCVRLWYFLTLFLLLWYYTRYWKICSIDFSRWQSINK